MSKRKEILFHLNAIDPESYNPFNPVNDKIKDIDWKNDC